MCYMTSSGDLSKLTKCTLIALGEPLTKRNYSSTEFNPGRLNFSPHPPLVPSPVSLLPSNTGPLGCLGGRCFDCLVVVSNSASEMMNDTPPWVINGGHEG